METAMRYHGLGRRKSSVARVFIQAGTGQWQVNGRTLQDYFPRHSLQQHASEPLLAVEMQSQLDVRVNVDGGGITGQAGAVRLGLARALVRYDEELRPRLREKELLTRDPREVERKKPGQPGARKRFQFSKR
ncbi:MAG: 30S ribosomal protein S9 [Gemmatimonadota bacterium]|jgi:small subunit ribosomal protein S9